MDETFSIILQQIANEKLSKQFCCLCRNPFEKKLLINECFHAVCYPCARSIFEDNKKIKFCPQLDCTKKFNTKQLTESYQENFEITEILCSLCYQSPENCGLMYQHEDCGSRYCSECILNLRDKTSCPANNCNESLNIADLDQLANINLCKQGKPETINCNFCKVKSPTIFKGNFLYQCCNCDGLFCLEDQAPNEKCYCVCPFCEIIQTLDGSGNKQFKYCYYCGYFCIDCLTQLSFEEYQSQQYNTGKKHCEKNLLTSVQQDDSKPFLTNINTSTQCTICATYYTEYNDKINLICKNCYFKQQLTQLKNKNLTLIPPLKKNDIQHFNEQLSFEMLNENLDFFF